MLQRFNEAWTQLVDKMYGWFNSAILGLPNFILALLLFLFSLYFARQLKKIVRRGVGRATKNTTVVNVVSNLSVAVFMLFTIFLVLIVLELDEAVTALLGTAGVVGLAVGLALQDPMVNLFSGVLMSVKQYYQIGDHVETNGYFGKIKQITLRATILMTPDGQEVVIPNKDVVQNPIVNYSHYPCRRIDVQCGVAYGDDLRLAQKTALMAIKENVAFSSQHPVEFFYTEFGDSSVNFVIRFWQNITSPAHYLLAQHKCIIAIKEAFDRKGITIPFPITTLDFGVVGGQRLEDLAYFKKSNQDARTELSLSSS